MTPAKISCALSSRLVLVTWSRAPVPIANPIAAIWAGAMMLEHLGQPKAYERILAAIEKVLASGSVKTPDLGGKGTTVEMTAAITAAMQ